MKTKKHRYMITIDDITNKQLEKIMIELKTKQRSKAIKFAILSTRISIMLSTIEQIKHIDKQIKEIKENL